MTNKDKYLSLFFYMHLKILLNKFMGKELALVL